MICQETIALLLLTSDVYLPPFFLLFLQIFFRNKVTVEDGYILFVRKNALQVFIPKYGFEGTLFLKEKGKEGLFIYNEQVCTNVNNTSSLLSM